MSIKLTTLVFLAATVGDLVLGAPTTLQVGSSITDLDCSLVSKIVDQKYPLTDPITLPDGSIKFRLAIISDLDADSVSSKEANTYISYFKEGYLTYNPANKEVSIEWDATSSKKFKSNLGVNGRGLELSELSTYNGQLLTFDDKTGLVYVIENSVLIPWVIVVEGNGRQKKGMKNEWATVKDSKLYVGTHGKEMVSSDGLTVTSTSPMWVKTIDKNGAVKHLDWTENFIKLRAAVGINFPGYMTHEACEWSEVHGRWFFLPRKASTEPFNQETDEHKGTNFLLMASPDFNDIKVVTIGNIVPNHGYASFKFIPGTNESVITAINTLEEGENTATFITVFTVDGQILYPETKVVDMKFEGVEFI